MTKDWKAIILRSLKEAQEPAVLPRPDVKLVGGARRFTQQDYDRMKAKVRQELAQVEEAVDRLAECLSAAHLGPILAEMVDLVEQLQSGVEYLKQMMESNDRAMIVQRQQFLRQRLEEEEEG